VLPKRFDITVAKRFAEVICLYETFFVVKVVVSEVEEADER